MRGLDNSLLQFSRHWSKSCGPREKGVETVRGEDCCAVGNVLEGPAVTALCFDFLVGWRARWSVEVEVEVGLGAWDGTGLEWAAVVRVVLVGRKMPRFGV